MKKLSMSLLGLLFVVSCSDEKGDNGSESSSTFDPNGLTSVIDGNQKEVDVNYDCIGCDSLISEDGFNSVVQYTHKKLISAIYHPKTFVPKKIKVIPIKKDSTYDYKTGNKFDNLISVYVKYSYEAANSYGNVKAGDSEYVVYMNEGSIVENISERFRLDSLKFDDVESYNDNGKKEVFGVINRTLSLYYKDDFLKIAPQKSGHFVVNSNISCTEEGASLRFIFEDEKDLRMSAWNDFNCDSKSYFTIKKGVKEILRKNKVKMISFSYKSESVIVPVPENERDYFAQLVDLID